MTSFEAGLIVLHHNNLDSRNRRIN